MAEKLKTACAQSGYGLEKVVVGKSQVVEALQRVGMMAFEACGGMCVMVGEVVRVVRGEVRSRNEVFFGSRDEPDGRV